MSNPGLTITDIVLSIRKHKGLVVAISVAAAVAGAIFYLAGPKKYEAKAVFILRNPLYGDRNYLYNTDTKFLDYFANEDDINRVILLAESDLVQSQVIKNMHLADSYKIDVSNRKGQMLLEKRFNKNLNIIRTENKSIELTYDDVSSSRAALVANECVAVLDKEFYNYFHEMRKGMEEVMVQKINEEDSAINAMTDTLTTLRNQYGIYDIVSPSRYNVILSGIKDNGHKDFGRGVEVIQNIESIKDELVTDRAKQTSIVTQLNTGLDSKILTMLKIITPAKDPVNHKGLGGMLTVLVCGFLGFFFSTMLSLYYDSTFLKDLKAAKKSSK